MQGFSNDPWPRWTFQLEDGTVIEHELLVRHGAPVTALSWRLREPRPDITLSVRLLISGRDYHATITRTPQFASTLTSAANPSPGRRTERFPR
jgi:Glycogen debranching enzyme N terminal